MATATYQYNPTKTRSYDDGYYYYDDPQDNTPFDVWKSDTYIRQGSYIDVYLKDEIVWTARYGPYYGTLFFGSGAGKPTELAGKTVVSARLRLRRVDTGADNLYLKLWKCNLTDVPGGGAKSPDGSYVSGSDILLGTYNDQGTYVPYRIDGGETKWFDLPTEYADWVIAGKCLVLHYGASSYARVYGVGTSYPPILEITVEVAPPIPTLSKPVLNQVSVIDEPEHEFSWSPSTDASGIFQQSELSYELEISTDGGTTWGATISVAAGTILQSVDLVEHFTLAAHSYYPNCKFRVRAVSPAYEENVYYSDWAVSERFAIDYRIEMTLPILYDALHWVIPEHDFGDAFALKIVNKIRLRGKGGTCGVTPKMNGELGTRVEVELPDDTGFVDVPLYAKGRTIGFIIDNGLPNEDGGFDPIEIYDIQIPYDAEEE